MKFPSACLIFILSLFVLSACTSTRPLRQVFDKPISEKVIKTSSDSSIEITQSPTVQEPVLKFIVVTPTGEYTLKKYEKIEKFEKTTSYKPLSTIGWILTGFGILYFLDNPAPDPADYKEDKYNDLSKEALSNRKTGMTIAALGAVAAGIGMFTDTKTVVTEKSLGMVEEKISKNPQKIQFAFSISGSNVSEISGTTDEKGEGMIKIDELLNRYISGQAELPEKVTAAINLEGDQNTKNEISFTLKEAIAIESKGKIDWSKGEMPKGFVPYLEAKAELTGTAKAGSAVILKIHLSNKEGKSDCYRLRVITKSDEPVFDNRRILIGYLKAGEEIQTEEKIEIPNDYKFTKEGKTSVSVKFEELNGFIPKPIELNVEMFTTKNTKDTKE